MDDSNLRMFDYSKSVESAAYLYDQGVITYYDQIHVEGFGIKKRTASRKSKLSNSNVASPPSTYAFRVTPIEQVASRWYGPIYRVTYTLAELNSIQPMQARSEYVFGGGLIGLYTHALLGERGDYSDKDFKYLSCGYASRKPAAWRPRFSSNPNAKNYRDADYDFLRPILP